jgi:hypothetical protein
MTERSDKMSVIGRLDDQVEAVLINPLKRERRSDGEAERDAPPPTPAPLREEQDTESSERTRDTEATLPVWLL